MLNKITKIEIEDLSETGHRVGVEVLEDGTFMLKIGYDEEKEYECAIVEGEVLVAFLQAHLTPRAPDGLPRAAKSNDPEK